MISKRKLIYVILLISLLPLKSIASDVHLPSTGFDCSDTNNKFEFLFDRIDGKFVLIGNLLAEKQGAYVIWEDKYFFTTTDFAWTFDKVTSKLSSVVLSVGLGTEDLNKIPKPMTCMQKIFYY